MNGIVIVLYLKRKSIWTQLPNILLLHHAIVDLFSSHMFTLPLGCIHLWFSDKIPHYLESAKLSVFLMVLCSDLLAFILTTASRWSFTCRPGGHLIYSSRWKIYANMLIIWMVSLIVACVSYSFDFAYYANSRTFQHSITTVISLCIAVILVFLQQTYYKAWKYLRDLVVEIDDDIEAARFEIAFLKRALRMTQMIALMFFLLLLPLLMNIVIVLKGSNTSLLSVVYILFSLLSVINPVLTCRFTDDFRIKRKRLASTSAAVEEIILSMPHLT